VLLVCTGQGAGGLLGTSVSCVLQNKMLRTEMALHISCLSYSLSFKLCVTDWYVLVLLTTPSKFHCDKKSKRKGLLEKVKEYEAKAGAQTL